MYPFGRLALEMARNWRRNPLAVGEVHVTHLRVWPWDIDMMMELDNGRILSLMDLGRHGFFIRSGILKALKTKGWYGTVAGSAVRYRHRITLGQKLELRTRVIGWDARFVYFDQAFWRGQECCAHVVLRTAITTGKGIVPTGEIAEVLGYDPVSPSLPDWVAAWADAETQRSWPPAY